MEVLANNNINRQYGPGHFLYAIKEFEPEIFQYIVKNVDIRIYIQKNTIKPGYFLYTNLKIKIRIQKITWPILYLNKNYA